MYAWMYVWIYASMYVCMYVCMHVCMYFACVWVCVCVCVCVSVSVCVCMLFVADCCLQHIFAKVQVAPVCVCMVCVCVCSLLNVLFFLPLLLLLIHGTHDPVNALQPRPAQLVTARSWHLERQQ
jgi:hypothetical protein